MINYSDKKLWGLSGGQLEYVSHRQENRGYQEVMIIRFTDHDHFWCGPEDCPELIEGKYYELEFPINVQEPVE